MTSCDKLIDVGQPTTELTSTIVFQDEATATAAVLAIYTQLGNGMGSGGLGSLPYVTSLSSDDMGLSLLAPIQYLQFSNHNLLSTNTALADIWKDAYAGVYLANAAIDGLSNSKIAPALKNQLIGEAKFFRAFYHFYLVNLFGDIPYISSTDFQANRIVTRLPVATVYEKISSDLLDAKTGLTAEYPGAKERTRVNKWTATALLARVYLYQQDWLQAEEQAATVISKSSLYKLNTELNDVFLMNSQETIWQLIPPGTIKYLREAILYNPGLNSDVPSLTNAFFNNFEDGDQRREKWIKTDTFNGQPLIHPFKYKSTTSDTIRTEYYTVFRLAEQYLIRAEARAQLNKLKGLNSAEADINAVRTRAKLSPTSAQTQEQFLNAVSQERRQELFAEWGHRWLDLKRTGLADSALGPTPGWASTDLLYPIPYNEVMLDQNLTQNPGY